MKTRDEGSEREWHACWDDDYSSEWLDVTPQRGTGGVPGGKISTGK
jgi:hypothetical protein